MRYKWKTVNDYIKPSIKLTTKTGKKRLIKNTSFSRRFKKFLEKLNK